MPPFRGMSISGHIATFLVFHVTWALKLDIPSDVVLGKTIQVSWTSAADDPNTMDLFLSCDGGISYKMIASSVLTASASYQVTVPTLDIPDSQSPLSCDVQARAMDDVTVLDGIIIDVATPAIASSESTWEPNQSSSTPTASVEENILSLSASDPMPSFSFVSTPTSASLPTINSADVSFSSSSFQSLPVETSTSRPAQYSSTLSSSSTDISTTSFTSTSSTINVLPSVTSPTQAPTIPIGTILGAIIGGLLGLLILALLMSFLYRRRHRRRPRSHRSGLMRDVKANFSSVPISEDKEESLLAKEETPYEASETSDSDTEHSGSPSHGHYRLNGDESPHNLDIQLQPMRFSESSSSILIPVLRAADVEEEDREVQHTDHRRSPSLGSSKSLTREEGGVYHETGSWNFSPCSTGYDRISQCSIESLHIDKMDPEAREQRRDALLEQMRRVLDGEKSV